MKAINDISDETISYVNNLSGDVSTALLICSVGKIGYLSQDDLGAAKMITLHGKMRDRQIRDEVGT